MEKTINPIANVLTKLRILKDLVRQMSKKSLSEDPTTSNMVKGPKHCRNLQDSTFIISTADGKYSLFNCANLKQPIQMQLSKKKRRFIIDFLIFSNLD